MQASIYQFKKSEYSIESGTTYTLGINSCKQMVSGTVGWGTFGDYIEVVHSFLKKEDSNVISQIRGFKEFEKSILEDLILAHNTRKRVRIQE